MLSGPDPGCNLLSPTCWDGEVVRKMGKLVRRGSAAHNRRLSWSVAIHQENLGMPVFPLEMRLWSEGGRSARLPPSSP